MHGTWSCPFSIGSLHDNGSTPVKDIEGATLYIPVEDDSEYPHFSVASREVVYSDSEFLEGFLTQSEQEYSYILANHRLDHQLAICLGLTPLSEHLDVSEEMFEDVRQHEKNILRDYKDIWAHNH